MKLSAFGLCLDAAILYSAVLAFFILNPLGKDIAVLGTRSAIGRVPLAQGPNSTVVASTLQLQEFIVGTELGYYGASTPQTATFLAESEWINSFVVPYSIRSAVPHLVSTWLRNLIAAYVLYFGVGSLWSVAIYWLGGPRWFPKVSDRPTWRDFSDQMQV